MRWSAVVVPATLIVACSSDPTLAVSVTHPSVVRSPRRGHGLRVGLAEVHRHRVRALDPAGLEALAADDVTLDGSASGDLSGISRTGHKVIVARGFATNMALVTVGCAEKDEIIGADR